jgi:endonuclease III
VLAHLNPEERRQQVERVCQAAKIRMPLLKAKYILGCFRKIEVMGGPVAAKRALLRQPKRDGKIQWLKELPGIGEKYARNIMMDVYHEDFRNSIAIDARIKDVSKTLGLSFNTYFEQEQFYLSVAKAAGLNGWELDRLIFNFKEEFLALVKSSS